jgi:hypothetical protein
VSLKQPAAVAAPVAGAMARADTAIAVAPPPATAPMVRSGCWSGCGLPCQEGIGECFHVRGVFGYHWFVGEDAPDGACTYWGFDVGRTLCGSECSGCWGFDAFFRTHGARFDRELPVTGGPAPVAEDGGDWYHVGLKATYEQAFGRSRFYWWAGAGPEYWWTDGYVQDDSGFGVFAEAGVGFVLDTHWRLRAGVNVHGLSTDVGRLDPMDDGDSRWLWVVAPVIEVEGSF